MYKYLNKINSPEDLKKFKIDELQEISDEVRDFILKNVAKTGGHLASSLGTVELTVALHYMYNSPIDKLIWDVGHQCYAHKILTGRKDQFNSLRQYQGLSGFLKSNESEHDVFQAGHTSTSISAAIGFAKARDASHRDYHVIPIIGDGALTGGMAFEALNYLGHSEEDVTIILNDNGMSIDENVGALSNSLSKIRTSNLYKTVKKDTKLVFDKVPKIGDFLNKKTSKVKNTLKYLLIPNMFFEELGFTYLGPIDGHDLKDLTMVFERAKKIDGPVLIHTITTKGKGYSFAEDKPDKYHGVGQINLHNGQGNSKAIEKYSHVFGTTLLAMAKKDEKIFGLTAAMPSGTGLLPFKEALPERYIDVGIAEQNATTIAAGLAKSNFKPYFAVYSTFLQRAYDQVIHDVCIQNLPVTFCIDRAGLVGKDGETHHGVFDLSYLIPIPNLTIMAPKDKYEFIAMLNFSKDFDQPLAIRYPRGKAEKINKTVGDIQSPEILIDGEDIAVVAVGKMVSYAIETVNQIQQDHNINIRLINPRILKPFNRDKMLTALDGISKIITIEDNAIIGGYGSYLNQQLGNQFDSLNIGIEDHFIEQGDTAKLFEINGLNSKGLYKKIINFLL